ncbi:hypothetical protein ACFPYJ_22015 [Paenibacillus solisilvae]|uniref:Uncharacterized protein n=1 Tax=Paenibacillus solisilvae TaxID=2486751 RepID=A0ABW0W237_9BACL
MNELIKLLFSNIYVIVVIVGVIMAIVRRTSRGTSGNRMPSFGGKPDPQNTEMRNRQPAQKPLIRTLPAAEQQVTAVRTQTPSDRSEYEENDFLTHLVEEQTSASKKSKQSVSNPGFDSRVRVKRQEAFYMPKGDDLRKAVILAEVLGPPRAKRPFHK